MEFKVTDLVQADQMDRALLQKPGATPEETNGIWQRDRERRQKLQLLISNGGVTTASEFADAALLMQHGETVADYEKALEYSQKAIALGMPMVFAHYPQIVDRLQMQRQIEQGIDRQLAKQKYGTQFWIEDGKVHFNPLDGTATQEEIDGFGLVNTAEFEGKTEVEYGMAYAKKSSEVLRKYSSAKPK